MENLTERLEQYNMPETCAAFKAAVFAFKSVRNFRHKDMATKSGLESPYLNIIASRQPVKMEHVNAMEAVLPGFKQLFFANLFSSEPGAALTVPIPGKDQEIASMVRLIEIVEGLRGEITTLKKEVQKLKSGK